MFVPYESQTNIFLSSFLSFRYINVTYPELENKVFVNIFPSKQ